MNKEYLEALEDLIIEFDELGFEPTILCDQQKEIESFRNRLMKIRDYLKLINNANPSEALECFIETIRMFGENQIGLDRYEEKYNTIKQALIKAQEQEKILEIIFEKGIDIGWLRQCKTVEEYNYHCEAKHLTQEEFELLKRWLENDRI